MPLDAPTVCALCAELSKQLVGGKIDKIQMPENDKLVITLRNNGQNMKLLLCAGTGSARVHLTQCSFENPADPPMFCMLLRKHLTGAHITSLTQPDFERMIVIELMSRDELGFEAGKKLIIEMIGRSSNIILVGADGRIVDCIRRMSFGGDELRRMLPGMFYRMPPKQDKLPFFESSSDEKHAILPDDCQLPPEKWLLKSFSGLSPLICRELSYRAGESYELLPMVMDAVCESVSNGEFTPFMLTDGLKPTEFSFMPIKQFDSGASGVCFESFSELLDAYYTGKDKAESSRRKSRELMRSVKTVRDRTARKLAGQSEELLRTESREETRKMAELVTANLYRLKKGMRSFECEDYYQPDSPVITIQLDPLKTPQQNAAALYKEYNKLKAAKEHLTVLVEAGEKQLDYLNSVLDELERAETEKDVADIRQELYTSGILKKQEHNKAGRIKAQQPLRFISDDGLEILAGRSNIQNDELTTKLARRTDYWLHTQKVHGSHVIIRCDGLEPPERTLMQAAAIAAYCSQARGSGKTAVDYTMVRFVRKPSGAMPGKVIYTDFSTLFVAPDEELIKRLAR